MPTIKDVARLAGVSHGTVSNVINGVKSVSAENVRRVEQAVQELGYKPNGIARSLKLNKTGQIDVVFPRVVDASLAQMHECISMFAMEQGYTVSLYITHENAEMEKKILDQSLMYNRDGVILMTCQPDNSDFFDKLQESGMPVVLLQRRALGADFPFVAIDGKPAIQQIVLQLLERHGDNIAILSGPDTYTFDARSVAGYKDAHFQRGFTVRAEYCVLSNYDRESSFKEAVRLLQQNNLPKAIVTSLPYATEAILRACEVLNLTPEQQPEIVALQPATWAASIRPGITSISAPYAQLAEQAFRLLMDCVEGEECRPKEHLIPIPQGDLQLNSKPYLPAVHAGEATETLRVLFTQDRPSAATMSLVSSFELLYGVKVECETAEYHKTYDALKQEWYRDSFDVFQVDIPWVSEFAQREAIEVLDPYLESDPAALEDFPADILEDFSRRDSRLYGLPYVYSGQLLFYRQDLFADSRNQRLFYQKYKRDLAPPVNWGEFNEVAEFFTRACNTASPTAYGTTLGSKLYSGAVCEFLPRLWGFGGDISHGDRFTLDTPEAVKALENYCSSFRYAAETSYDNWWREQTREFYQGDAAMMILFSENVTEAIERSHSKIIGKIGYELVPDRIGVKGGWVLSINSHSRQKELAYRFVSWACSRRMSVLSSILGGSVPCRTALENAEVANIYPWYRKAMEAKAYQKVRALPLKPGGICMPEPIFEDILGRAVYDAVTQRADPAKALSRANEQLNSILQA